MMSSHQPVLLEESLRGLSVLPGGVYIDGTYGRGGHTRAILNKVGQDGKVIGIDKDDVAIAHGKTLIDKRHNLVLQHGSFADIHEHAERLGVFGKVNGILLDLGVSSPQLDDASRGFSFLNDGPLDMRMDRCHITSACDWIAQATEDEMSNVFKSYGEERFARRVARAIVVARLKTPIDTTAKLARIISEALPFKEAKKHPATRVFQAIRIYINRELDDLKQFLSQFIDVLSVGGRLVIISFHSLEDRLVKRCFRQLECGHSLPRELPIHCSDPVFQPTFKRCGRAIKPSLQECGRNMRARSAIMRVGEKIA